MCSKTVTQMQCKLEVHTAHHTWESFGMKPSSAHRPQVDKMQPPSKLTKPDSPCSDRRNQTTFLHIRRSIQLESMCSYACAQVGPSSVSCRITLNHRLERLTARGVSNAASAIEGKTSLEKASHLRHPAGMKSLAPFSPIPATKSICPLEVPIH